MTDQSESTTNVYADSLRAQAYATLAFPGTYYLAFRDLPGILRSWVTGKQALDFGCGAGRSTRLLRSHGFEVVGVDIAAEMVEKARELDPGGDYRVIRDGDFSGLGRYDVILAAFTFDNIAGRERRQSILTELGRLLSRDGVIVVLGSTPEIYWNEWSSCTTAPVPENRNARSGEPVRIIMKDVPDSRPVIDTIWFPEDYAQLFRGATLDVVATEHPLGSPEDGIAWVSEERVAPWVIYVARRAP